MVIDNKMEPKQGTKYFAISIRGGGGSGKGSAWCMVYLSVFCQFSFLAYESWQGGVAGVGAYGKQVENKST